MEERDSEHVNREHGQSGRREAPREGDGANQPDRNAASSLADRRPCRVPKMMRPRSQTVPSSMTECRPGIEPDQWGSTPVIRSP
jgi:hypothetical protein